jgi:hypothetical protein
MIPSPVTASHAGEKWDLDFVILISTGKQLLRSATSLRQE